MKNINKMNVCMKLDSNAPDSRRQPEQKETLWIKMDTVRTLSLWRKGTVVLPRARGVPSSRLQKISGSALCSHKATAPSRPG